jgi:hypothetical protein
MPWLMQMIWFCVLLLGLAFALWIGFWLLLVIFSVSVIAVVWVNLRQFLVAKGIMNPTFGVPPSDAASGDDATPSMPMIEGEFTRVDDKKAP